MKIVGAILFSLVFLVWGGTRIVKTIQFERNCGGYLKRAADANTVSLAKENLEVSIKFLEENQITSGYTSILWRSPKEDVGYWYKNLKASLSEMEAVRSEASQLETSNVLMKLRETLLDHTSEGTKVTAPPGISVYPNNTLYAWWGMVSLILASVFWVVWLNDL